MGRRQGVLFVNRVKDRRQRSVAAFPPCPMPLHIETIKNYIEHHLGRIGGPTEVADALGYKYETLRKFFRREEGISLGRFIQERRVTRMKVLLRETDLNCNEIGWQVGLRREDYTARFFKRMTGKTMTEYREEAAVNRSSSA